MMKSNEDTFSDNGLQTHMCLYQTKQHTIHFTHTRKKKASSRNKIIQTEKTWSEMFPHVTRGLVKMSVAPIWRTWVPSIKNFKTLTCNCTITWNNSCLCQFHDVTDRQKVTNPIPFLENGQNWMEIFEEKRFLSQMSQWLEDHGLMGRRLHFTPLSKSSEQSSEKKETDSSWPLSWKSCNSQDPRNNCQKLRPRYRPTDDRLSLSGTQPLL